MTTLLLSVSVLCVALAVLALRQQRLLRFHRAAETQLLRSGLAITQQLADLPLAVCAWDERRVVRTWGLGAEATFSLRSDSARGSRLEDLVAPSDAREAFARTLDAVLGGGCVPRGELASVTRDGRRVVCEWFHEPLREASGAVVGGLSLARDVTASVHAACRDALTSAVTSRLADDLPEAEALAALVASLEASRPDLDVALLRLQPDGRTLVPAAVGRLDAATSASLAADAAEGDASTRDGSASADAPRGWTRAIRGASGARLGALLVRSRDARAPDALDDELLAHAARLAAQVVTRREWERRRRGTERRLREAFRALPARAFVLDADGRLALANRAASAAWGLLPDDASGRDLRTLLVERPECDALLALADAARAGGTPVRRDALVLTDAPGCRRVLAACAVPLARGDTRGEVLCVLDDVTDARRAERARRTREAREHDALRLSGLGVLAGGLAHEVDGLVRSIHEGVGRIALGMNGDASLRDETAALERDAQRAADLVRLVLCCAGRAPSSAERLDLDALLRDMTHLLDAAAPSGARVELETSGGLPTVLGDAEQLRRLVLALVENAAEALPRGEGTVVVRTSARRLLRDDLAGLFLDRELREGSYVVLEVEDDGEGFDDALARRVFDPFFTTKATGRGLGLSAVLGIVRGHGGAVQLDSEPGRGTCVRVLLPAAGLAERVGERLGAG